MRDKYLTEAMGECWHEQFGFSKDSIFSSTSHCTKCNLEYSLAKNYDFSTWEGFGKLWEWVQEQGWWNDFLLEVNHGTGSLYIYLINPDKFANVLYKYLKGKE